VSQYDTKIEGRREMTIRIAADMDDDPYDADADADFSPAFRCLREVAPPRVHEPRGSSTVFTS
jgi:hypothetical protein